MLIRTIFDGYINSRWIDKVEVTRDTEGRFMVVVRMHGRTERSAIARYTTEQEAHAAIRKLGMKIKSLKVAFDEGAS